MLPCHPRKIVVRYDIVYYDSNWNELSMFNRQMLTAHEMVLACDEFNSDQQKFLRSGDAIAEGRSCAMFLSIGVVYVEV